MKTLVMKFVTETGTKVSINVPKVKDTVDDTKIKEFMELVKEKAVFITKSYHIIPLKCNYNNLFYRYRMNYDGYQKYLLRNSQLQFA